MTDSKLDVPLELQVFIEFIHDNLNAFSPYDLLGIPEGTTDKTVIRNAYMQRTKQFHPDRYFRKNIGSYANVLSVIFKAVTRAFSALQ